MRLITDQNFTCDRSVVALGMFDGVHIGHRVLLQRARVLANQRRVPLVVCTFLTHPLQVIAPEKCPPQLCTLEERCALMAELGVDVLVAQPFTKQTMDLLPEEYVGHLVRRFHPTDVVCGYNHTFGRKGQGTPALLAALGGALGFATSVVPKITYEDADVSSTAIRSLLEKGDVDIAARMLKRAYALDASLTNREGCLCRLQLKADGKQCPAPGSYRAACVDDARCYPVTAHFRKADCVTFALPESCKLGADVQLRLLCNCAIDF